MKLILRHLTYANVVSTLALFLVLGGTAYAASGGNFILGRSNSASSFTKLSSSSNTATLGLYPKAGYAPIHTLSSKVNANFNADRLDGLSAGSFQRRVTGTCVKGAAVTSVAVDGTTSCNTSMVAPIAMTPSAGGADSINLGSSHLDLYAFCHAGSTSVIFKNSSGSAATLNWIFSQAGSSTVNASGNVIGIGGNIAFNYTSRLEGQWI